ncbi:MAG: DUF4167 domain-containing protein, partial [Hyphomicrobiaceae bacterium]
MKIHQRQHSPRNMQKGGGGVQQTKAGRTILKQKLEHNLRRAREAADAGDLIDAENYYQHADHYFRMIAGT